MARATSGKTSRVEGWGATKRRAQTAAIFALIACGAAALNGCAGLASTSNAARAPQEAVQISPSEITFPNVAVGQKSTQTAVLTNTGDETVTITQLATSGTEFTTSGIPTPVSIGPGQSAKFQVVFSGSTSGTASGTLSATTTKGGSSSKVKLHGGASQALQLSLSTTSINFGSVLVNGQASQAVTLKNSGQSDLQITQIGVSGAAFSTSGVSAPVTIPAGQSMALQAIFAPSVAGTAKGTITITSNAQNPSASVALTGSAVAASYTMSLAPVSLNFGNVAAGSNSTQKVQLSNSGNSSVTVTQVAASGAGISVSGLATPVTLAPSQTVALSVTFAPTSAGTTTGSVTVTNNEGVNAIVAVTGTQTQPGLSLTPTSASFGSVVTGNTNSQTIQIKNSGTANLTVSQATVSGAGFSLSGLALPMTLTPGQSGNFNVQYAPQGTGSVTGAASGTSNAPNSPAAGALSGSAGAARTPISGRPGRLCFWRGDDGTPRTPGITG